LSSRVDWTDPWILALWRLDRKSLARILKPAVGPELQGLSLAFRALQELRIVGGSTTNDEVVLLRRDLPRVGNISEIGHPRRSSEATGIRGVRRGVADVAIQVAIPGIVLKWI